jgi:hypothetical protein
MAGGGIVLGAALVSSAIGYSRFKRCKQAIVDYELRAGIRTR